MHESLNNPNLVPNAYNTIFMQKDLYINILPRVRKYEIL